MGGMGAGGAMAQSSGFGAMSGGSQDPFSSLNPAGSSMAQAQPSASADPFASLANPAASGNQNQA